MLIKSLFIAFISTALISCFSDAPKKRVIIIDKSTEWKDDSLLHFSKNNKPKSVAKENKNIVKKKKITVQKSGLFPVTAKVIKHFSKKHQGLTFDTHPNQMVRAIRKGVVVYSGNKMKSHGRMITIKHPLGFYSSYARNQTLKVQSGDKIKKGQVIALTGKDNFYFEMKKFNTPINPFKYFK